MSTIADPLLEHHRRFARYNRWANARVADAVNRLSEDDYRADRGAFFGSLQGTLNHLLLADRLWLARIMGTPPPYDRLDLILYDDRLALFRARAAEDERIIGLCNRLDRDRLLAPLAYRTANGAAHEQPLHEVLAHVFNHQTHHRGQAHALLTGLVGEAPSLDLLYYLREAA
jgi:uncharacterized damage-inducible protein DinB